MCLHVRDACAGTEPPLTATSPQLIGLWAGWICATFDARGLQPSSNHAGASQILLLTQQASRTNSAECRAQLAIVIAQRQ
eukprot:7207450-Alexandrium_andersonii.AAC.1